MTPLTPEREARLIKGAQAGRSRHEAELLEAHEPLIRSIVNRFPKSASVDVDDLLQEGRLAFVEAIRSFDTSKPGRLNTMARLHVVRAVQSAAASGAAVPVPARTLSRYVAAWADTDDYYEAMTAATTGDRPMAASSFAAVFEAIHGTETLSGTDDEGRPLLDTIPGDLGPDLGGVAARKLAWELLDLLSKRDARIVGLYFGFEEEPLSDLEISERLGMTRATVQRRRSQAMEILREHAAASGRVS